MRRGSILITLWGVILWRTKQFGFVSTWAGQGRKVSLTNVAERSLTLSLRVCSKGNIHGWSTSKGLWWMPWTWKGPRYCSRNGHEHLAKPQRKTLETIFVFGLECVTLLKGVSGTCYNLYLAVFLAKIYSREGKVMLDKVMQRSLFKRPKAPWCVLLRGSIGTNTCRSTIYCSVAITLT